MPGRPAYGSTRRPGLTWADLGLDADALAWHERAHCRDTDPDAFFPEREPGGSANVATAKRVCLGCPVRGDCLGYALAHPEVVGIWGGLTELERRHLTGRARARPGRRTYDSEVARLTRAGLSAERIAAWLAISPRSVERARARQRHLEEAA
ncbi:hypothetical protein BAY59_01290 [Prauserella coralliicola]|nr:hypothetical protein BAY59_01290 [Prauserella coralliicola]